MLKMLSTEWCSEAQLKFYYFIHSQLLTLFWCNTNFWLSVIITFYLILVRTFCFHYKRPRLLFKNVLKLTLYVHNPLINSLNAKVAII